MPPRSENKSYFETVCHVLIIFSALVPKSIHLHACRFCKANSAVALNDFSLLITRWRTFDSRYFFSAGACPKITGA